MVQGGRWEGGSGWGTRVHPWRIHVDVWQNQYNIVKLKKERERRKKRNLMDREAWQATAHEVAVLGHDLATKLRHHLFLVQDPYLSCVM